MVSFNLAINWKPVWIFGTTSEECDHLFFLLLRKKNFSCFWVINHTQRWAASRRRRSVNKMNSKSYITENAPEKFILSLTKSFTIKSKVFREVNIKEEKNVCVRIKPFSFAQNERKRKEIHSIFISANSIWHLLLKHSRRIPTMWSGGQTWDTFSRERKFSEVWSTGAFIQASTKKDCITNAVESRLCAATFCRIGAKRSDVVFIRNRLECKY